MGIFQREESHVSQSSSMSYGMRWKHDYLRQISLAAISSIAITLMALLLVDTQSRKQVHLIVDGQIKLVETQTSLIQEMLDEQAITLKAHDQISIPLTGTIQDGDKVIIDHAVPIQLTVDGQTKQLYTTRETVKDVIHDLGISIAGSDQVKPALTSSVANQTDIKIVRINTQKVERNESLPFRVIKTADPSLTAGTIRVTQQGKPGVMVQHFEKEYHDGKLISMRMVGKEVSSKTMDKIIAVGTKKRPVPLVAKATAKPVKHTSSNTSSNRNKATADTSNNRVSKAGVDFTYKKMINVSMTAYSSQESGIGTHTATGTRVTEGRTIAVDPSVIPLGWWVYIEGVGFRRAEDTGGAIKGHKIDIYYDSLNRANSFGRKSGLKVYVIGPVKPQLN